jgi:hypothetical protein
MQRFMYVIAYAAICADQLAAKTILAANGGNTEFRLRIEEVLKWARVGCPLA